MPSSHKLVPYRQSNLGTLLTHRYTLNRNETDIKASINLLRRSISATRASEDNFGSRANNLGLAHKAWYEADPQVSTLDDAILWTRIAVNAAAQNDPRLVTRLVNLHDCLTKSASPEEQLESLSVILNACEVPNGIPIAQLGAMVRAIDALCDRGDYNRAWAVAHKATVQMPRVLNRSYGREDLQRLLTAFSKLSSLSCALCLESTSDSSQALEMLEQGRGIILGYLIDTKSDISALESECPDIASEFDSIRSAIARIDREIGNPIMLPADHRDQIFLQRSQLTRNLNDCIERIQALENHRGFLLPPSAAEMRRAAIAGTIILVNATSVRSDAVIVTQSAISHLPLPLLTPARIKRWQEEQLTNLNSPADLREKNPRYRKFLAWLWTSCVQPILNELHLLETRDSSDLPRIWWIGSGAASTLPFHAAGRYTHPNTTETALRWVLSSYTPTIKALTHARPRSSLALQTQSGPRKMTFVLMPETPGENALDGVNAEMTAIIECVIKSQYATTCLEGPSVQQVLDGIHGSQIVHFSCHGLSHSVDPSYSGLILRTHNHTPADDARTTTTTTPREERFRKEILTVHRISQQDFGAQMPRIAYLSACSTVEQKVAVLADEVIHLGSGFQAAGFPHVVGTLWPTGDRVSAQAAQRFYEELMKAHNDEPEKQGERAIAEAVRKATLHVLESQPGMEHSPLEWAQFVHIGP